MASTYLTKANPTANTDSRKKGTIAFWFKRSGIGATQYLYTEASDGNNAGVIYLSGSDTLNIISYDGGTSQTQLSTNAKYRDTNGWYHFCFSYDSTLGTADDRQKLWINGEQILSFSTRTNPSQDGNFWFGVGGSNYPIKIGINHGSSDYFNGYMSHFHRVDSQALNASVFGSTDATTGEWKITTAPSITYTGTSDFNFFILKDGNSVTDQSGQSNDLTVGGGTLTKSEDNPSNVFATMNRLFITNNAQSLNTGNTVHDHNGTTYWIGCLSTLGMDKGKYYAEVKIIDNTSLTIGFQGQAGSSNLNTSNQGYIGYNSDGWGVWGSGQLQHNNVNAGAYLGSLSNGDIVMLAIDMGTGSNGKVYFGVNGSWGGSSNPSNGTSPAYDNETFPSTMFFASGLEGGEVAWNFGNGYFGTTAISSEGTNASGIGKFEYDVPTGYTALSTKGLNE